MKKCRCPWCGTECIPAIDKVFQRRRWQEMPAFVPPVTVPTAPKQKESAFPILYVLAVLLRVFLPSLTREPLWLMAMGAGVVSIPFRCFCCTGCLALCWCGMKTAWNCQWIPIFGRIWPRCRTGNGSHGCWTAT